MTFVQHFGSTLNVNPHFHVLMHDGVFVEGPAGRSVFLRPSSQHLRPKHSIPCLNDPLVHLVDK